MYIKCLPSNSTLSLKLLTLKTVMLFALTRPSRSADLCLLGIDYYRFSPEGLSFTPLGLTKQSRAGNPTKEIFFDRFTEDESICPVSTALSYIQRTESLRLQATKSKQGKFFISWIKPHYSVTSASIARWLRQSWIKQELILQFLKLTLPEEHQYQWLKIWESLPIKFWIRLVGAQSLSSKSTTISHSISPPSMMLSLRLRETSSMWFQVIMGTSYKEHH